MRRLYWAGVAAAGLAFALADAATAEPLRFDEMSPKMQVEFVSEQERSMPLWRAILQGAGLQDLLTAYNVMGADTLTQTRVVFGNPPAGWVDPRGVYLGITLDLADRDPLVYVIPAFQEGEEDVRVTTIHEGCHAREAVWTGAMQDHGLFWSSCMRQMGLSANKYKESH